MDTISDGDLADLRSTLRTLKQHDAVSGAPRLAYAIDKTLRTLETALKTFDEHTDALADKHKRTDEEGRDVVSFRGIPLVRRDGAFYHADTGDEFASVEDLSQVADRLPVKLEDPEAYHEEVDVLRDATSEVSLHTIEADAFFEHADLEGIHSQIDLTILDLILKDE